jgi:DNA-binding NarL/FixJ family response regulator
VDDHQLVREGIRALLRKRAGITVVAEADNGIEALELIKTLQPNIVLSDIAIPGLNGLALTERVTAEAPNVRVIILSMHQSEAHVLQALSAGAAGYRVSS